MATQVSFPLFFDANLIVKTSDGWTPHMNSLSQCHSDVIELLQKGKVYINAFNKNGASAIYIACQNGHTAVTSTLLQFNADPNLKNFN